MSDTIASPTPDEKDYKGEMDKKEYDKQPESNTGATVERDVDEPNPKEPEQVILTDQDEERERKHREIMEAEKNNPPDQQVLPQTDPVPQDAQEKHAAEVTDRQRDKLDPNQKVRSQ